MHISVYCALLTSNVRTHEALVEIERVLKLIPLLIT